MEFSRKFAAFPRKKQIAIVVWSVHFLIVFCLAFHHLVTRSFSKPRPIIVRTFEPSAPKPAIQVQKTAPSAPAKKAEKSNPPTAKAVSKAKPKQTAKKAAPKPIESALEEIAKSLDAVAPAEPSKRSTLSLPAKIEPVAHLAEESRASPEYADFLITYLQHSLDLPEHGDVRAEIRIDRFGNLIDCLILDAKSQKNAAFLKKRLPELAFPCFNDFSIDDAALSFTITFRNVEIH